jgi:putative tryptophan/tyrosine transport system substrate-binding protein
LNFVTSILLFLPTHSVFAQQPKKVPRAGYLSGIGDPSPPGPQIEAFQRGLRDLGYIEEKNILIEYRYAEGKLDRAPALIAELLQLKVDILIATFSAAIRAAKQATKTTPIVMETNQDPVATGDSGQLSAAGRKYHGTYQTRPRIKWKAVRITYGSCSRNIPRRSPLGCQRTRTDNWI